MNIKKKGFVWDYSKKSDILNIHKAGRKVDGSAEFEDFTIDFDGEGQVAGIEIAYASEFLSDAGIQKEQLAKIKEAEIAVNKRNNYAVIWIKLSLPNLSEPGEAIVEKKVTLPVPIIN
ncbi:DUF2283 domain-containing protein [Candidatus Woesearchaeota archaeon]|nr:DUF2283 domain-containing protein [Candidatus Woesearchaeota archaeon]